MYKYRGVCMLRTNPDTQDVSSKAVSAVSAGLFTISLSDYELSCPFPLLPSCPPPAASFRSL